MSYKINKTNGELLVDLVDGQIDNTSTDITLVGRNFKGFGELVNENFVRLLENFARTSAPNSPLVGQLWYDTAEERLKIYTGETFRSAAGAVVSSSQPNLVAGDLWIDSADNKLYFFDGADIVLVGPQYSESQGRTSVEAATILDNTGKDQTVLYMYIAGQLTGIYSRTQFRPNRNITGFPVDETDTNIPKRQIIRQGFNPVSTDFVWRGTAQSTQSLVNDSGESFTEANFMKTDRDTSTTGSLTIRDRDGLNIGEGDTTYAAFKISNTLVTQLETQRTNRDFALRVRRGNTFDNVLYADASLKRVGIYTDTPSVGFDVNTNSLLNGDVTVTGNLTVNGDSIFINSQTLQVEDKNIELSITDGSPAGDDTVADGGGVILRSTDSDKSIIWYESTGNWTFNTDVDIESGQVYKINDVAKLSANRLEDSVLYAEGLVRIGTLQSLSVEGNISITDGGAITSTQQISLQSTGTITVNDELIQGVTTPVSARRATLESLTEDSDNSVATKEYVDQEVKAEPVVFPLDTTGFTSPSADFVTDGPYNDVKDVLEYLYPASEKQEDTVARIHCTSYTATTVTNIEVDKLVDDPDNPGGPQISAAKISYIDVDDSTDGDGRVSVVEDIEFLPVSATAGLNPDRATMEFTVTSGVWVWQRTSPL